MAEARYPALTERELKTARSLREKKYREQHNAFLSEGVRLCEEALDAGASIIRVMVTTEVTAQERVRRLLNACEQQKIPISSVAEAKYRSISDEPSPAGIAMVVQKRPTAVVGRSPLILAVDALHDPGNLGTILRSADWFGANEVLLGKNCVDLYNPKVIRAGMGSIFRLHIEASAPLDERLNSLKRQGYRLLAADASSATPLAQVVAGERDLLLIGSEAHGIAPALFKCCDAVVRIPKQGGGESLNAAVAASILLYHFTQFGNTDVNA